MLPTLYVLQGPDKGLTYQASDEPVVIGRTIGQVVLADSSASRRHAELRCEGGVWILEDLKSSNGTYLNGQRLLRPATIKHGDQIKIGSTVLVFSAQRHVGGFSGPDVIKDLVDVDLASHAVGSSILTTVDPQGESIILQPQETTDAVAAWNLMFLVAEAVGAIDSVDALLTRVSDLVFDNLLVDRLALLLLQPGNREPVPHVIRFRGAGRQERPKIETSRRIIQHVIKTGEGVLCANAINDPRFGTDDMADSIHRMGLRSIICVPILVRNEVQGILHLDCPMSRHTYSQEQLRLVVAVGRLVGLSLEHRRLLESRLRNERLAATGETVAHLSHQIRNILQGLQGGAEVVEKGFQRRCIDTARSGWTMVRHNLDRTYRLAMNMLTFSKDREPYMQPTPLNRVVEDALELCRHGAGEKGVTLTAELEEVPLVPMDDAGVHQVILNIILNAIDASPAGNGAVVVRTHHDYPTGRVVVSVSDNGHGIPNADREKIFSVFHSSKGHRGTGLGLAAAKKIIDEHHGEILIDSEVGVGTTFHIQLHVGQPDPAVVDRTRTLP